MWRTTWQQENVDLTPLVGQTIQVVFYYEAVVRGTRLWLDVGRHRHHRRGGGWNDQHHQKFGQGTFAVLASSVGLVRCNPVSTPSITISNLPPGQYVLQFGDVPYYQTPAAQTNTLAAGGTVNFNGNYTFIDANNNGISDDWEQDYFGSVSTTRTQKTDTDHDGMTDYAEFIAGTDPTNPASRFYFTGVTSRPIILSRSSGPLPPTGCIRSIPPPIFDLVSGHRLVAGLQQPRP